MLMLTVPKKQQPKLSAKIKDANNWSGLQLKSHQHIHNAVIAKAEASAKLTSTISTAATTLPLGASTSKVINSNVKAETQPKGKFLF